MSKKEIVQKTEKADSCPDPVREAARPDPVRETARLCLCAVLANGDTNPEPQDAVKMAYRYATAFENHNNT